MREDQQVLRLALSDPLVKKIEGRLGAVLQICRALFRARSPHASMRSPQVIHIQGDDLQTKVCVLYKVGSVGHEKVIQVAGVGVDLRTLRDVICANARVMMKVMVPVDAVPWHGAQRLRVDLPPLRLPLRIAFVGHTVRVEGVANVDHKLHVAQILHGLVHGISNCLLASGTLDLPVHLCVPAPIADHQEGPGAVCEHGPG
mmetsp:Transcript_61333/g.154822  ORF Transcript_61333/g.154822 Transcript_61333/m.154822 type:complete len:201 (-) Transcript_61333:287-889(-)